MKAKSAVRAVLRAAVASDACWRVIRRTLVPAAEYAASHRKVLERWEMVAPIVEQMMPDLRVATGPFQGMQYPELRYFGGEIFPKFLGSFERELHPIVEEICGSNYSEVVNIGCAEGHYLVGLGMRRPGARLYGYDIDPAVRAFCGWMAERNGVADRLELGGFCNRETLLALPLRRALILSDCEGYEAELFDAATVEKLAGHDFLIEVHDNFQIETSSKLLRAFAATHTVERISSLDDIAKAREYDYPQMRGYDLRMRKELLMEGRSAIMEWFFCRSTVALRPGKRASRDSRVLV